MHVLRLLLCRRRLQQKQFAQLLLTVRRRLLFQMLLYRMMPSDVIDRLQRGEAVIETHPNATIFFSHIIGFSTLSGSMRPSEFMSMLNEIYAEFDRLVLKHKLYKIETIGDTCE